MRSSLTESVPSLLLPAFVGVEPCTPCVRDTALSVWDEDMGTVCVKMYICTPFYQKASKARKEMIGGVDEAAEASACVCACLEEGTEDIALLRRWHPSLTTPFRVFANGENARACFSMMAE